MKISIIIPAYNEEQRLTHTLKRTIRFLEDNRVDFELVLVDDGSTDTTRMLFEKAASNDSRIIVESYDTNRGKGFAVRTGVLASSGEYIFFMDADGSNPIEELPKFLKEFLGGAHVVIGSRHLPGSTIHKNQPLYRRLLGRTANGIIRVLLLPGIKDTQCGFKGFSREAALALFNPLKIYRWGFDFEILTRARTHGYTIIELPVQWIHSEGSRIRPIKSFIRTFIDLVYVLVFVRILKR